MQPYRVKAAKHADGTCDLSIGSPTDPVPKFVQQALNETANTPGYPPTSGSPAVRQAIADWYERRRAVQLTPEQTLPTVGSKELVALLPFLLGLGPEDTVVYPEIAYPSYAIGAHLTGAQPCPAVHPDDWPQNTRLVWLNTPSNPTGQVLDVPALRQAVTRARQLGAIIVSDECYAELGWVAPWNTQRIPSILDPRVTDSDSTGILAAYSLSKQSNMAGYRAAFIAGDRQLIAQLLNIRMHAGLITPAPVQAALTAALKDDRHVAEQREKYRLRRETLLPALNRAGFTVAHSEAGLYLWATRGEDAWKSLDWLAEHGIVAGPGHFYGDASPEHVRFSLTASDPKIRAAANRLSA